MVRERKTAPKVKKRGERDREGEEEYSLCMDCYRTGDIAVMDMVVVRL